MTVVPHVVSVGMIVLHHAKAVASAETSAVLHARTAAMTVLLHVVSVVRHHATNAVMLVSLQARAVTAANHLTARVTASARHHTRTVSSHCVAVREKIIDLTRNSKT
jgi:hypothetical protein